MELRLLFLCSLLLQLHWANARARRPETTSDYWKESFPNVELPKSLQNVLKPTEGDLGASKDVGKDILKHNTKPNGQKNYAHDANENVGKYLLKHNTKPDGQKNYAHGANENVGKDLLKHDTKPNGQKNYAYSADENVGKDLLKHDTKPDGQKNYADGADENVGKDLLKHDTKLDGQKNYADGADENVGKDLLKHDTKPDGQKNYAYGADENVGKDLLKHDTKPDGQKNYADGADENVGKDLLKHNTKPDGQKNYADGADENVGKDLLKHNTKPDGQKNYAYGADENVGKDLLKHNTKPEGQKNYAHGANENVGKDLLKHNTKPDGQKNYAHGGLESVVEDSLKHNVKPNSNKYYDLDASDNLKPDSGVATYFLEKDLLKEKKMKLHFTSPINGAKFLPREIANSIPFSSNKLLEILNRFGIKPKSDEAKIVQQTISECERPTGIEGEYKYCATSLESLIDFSRSKLGEKMKIYSTMIDKETKQVYNIKKGSIQKVGDKSVVCHKENYLYAVYYCHQIQDTRMYMASLEGVDGSKVNAIAACHVDTRSWNPKHLAFQLLNVKPGSGPICHFLSSDILALVPN